MKPTPIKPMRVSPAESLLRRIVRWVLAALMTIAFSLLLAVVLIEWLAGCGESYVAYDGVRHMGECVFITPFNHEPNLN